MGLAFGDRLAALVSERESQVVLGLDPDPERLWPQAAAAVPSEGSPAERTAAAVTVHCAAVIDAAGPACVAVKPQVACFERLGAPGWAALHAVAGHARGAGLMVLADGKRGDIDVTATAYVQGLVGPVPTPRGDVPSVGADAFTVNPYMGIDTLQTFVAGARAMRAAPFVLVRTSNPGAVDVEDLELAAGGRVWEAVARIVDDLGEAGPETGLSDVGAVVGATEPRHLARARELMPRTVLLLPGVGAQGGRVEDLAPAFAPGRAGGLVTASRSLVFAHARDRPTHRDPAAATRAEAERLRAAAWAL